MKVLNKILEIIDYYMDYSRVDTESLSPEALGITKERRDKYLILLYMEDYIAELSVVRWIDGVYKIDVSNARLTMKGLEYLESLKGTDR